MHPLEALKKNPFVLAPMAGITDSAFRSFMRKKHASLVITELVSVHGIDYKSPRTLRLMEFSEDQRPIGIQLFGEDPEMVGRAARAAEESGCDFVDLNFGCPVPKVVKKGAGSAMLKDLPAMAKMLRATVAAVKIPVTIKIRTGWDANTRNADEVTKIAYNEGITWVAIHGRTRAQGYSGLADWDFIAEVKSKSPLPIIGNGDILSPEQALMRIEQTGCDGVMIGRGALKNPGIFAQALLQWQNAKEAAPVTDIHSIYQDLAQTILLRCEAHVQQIQLKKFAAWYATGYPGASQFRKKMFQAKENAEILDLADEFFSANKFVTQEDTSREAFLMGGHG